jgi:probable HAF family extracellular repeat protein
MIRTIRLLIILFSVLSVTSAGTGGAKADYAYTQINVPASLGTGTEATGINNTGQIVGTYFSNGVSGTIVGFLKSGSTYSTIDFPGSTQTNAYGINDLGQVVGSYRVSTTTGNFTTHGFLLSGST